MINILVTGATGYIGSHTIVELIAAGYLVVGIDNFSNSSSLILKRINEITGKKFPFYEIDFRDISMLSRVCSENKIDAVIHFAGLKSVGESVAKPLFYYDSNIKGTISLLMVLEKFNIKNIVFSSSATVYGLQKIIPIKEAATFSKTEHPYGTSKVIIEKILSELSERNNTWKVAILRYFNPVGSHSSGLIGDHPRRIQGNLMPNITRAAAGLADELLIFGGDWPTKDGTPVRDYVHVMDIAKGHLAALDHLIAKGKNLTINLGTGKGVSVLEVVKTFMDVNKCEVPYKIVNRRPGDIAEYFADVALAKDVLGWVAEKTLEDMCRDAWKWQRVGFFEI